MEVWELIKRLLAGATGGNQSFMPGLIGGLYYRDLLNAGRQVNQSFVDVSDVAELFGDQMLEAGLIRPAGVRGGGIAILEAMERTEFGEELYRALGRRDVVTLFEGGDVQVDAEAIRKFLLQVN